MKLWVAFAWWCETFEAGQKTDNNRGTARKYSHLCFEGFAGVCDGTANKKFSE